MTWKEKQNQCEEFLIASVEIDLDDDGDDAVVMEMGVLNRIEPSQLEIS